MFLVLASAILLTACANLPTPADDPSQPHTPSASETKEASKTTEAPVSTAGTSEDVTEVPETTRPVPEQVQITADYATDEILNSYDSFFEFIEFDEISQRIIFTSNVRVKKLSFIEVDYEEKDGEFAFFEKEELYSIEDFSPDKPLLVSWMDIGAIPHRGISFVDENDRTRYFYLAASGEDGSLILGEFQN